MPSFKTTNEKIIMKNIAIKTLSLLLSAGAACLFLLSCGDDTEDTTPPPPPPPEPIVVDGITLKATISDAVTRTEPGGNDTGIKWAAGDEIGVYYIAEEGDVSNHWENEKFLLKEGAGNTTATFSLDKELSFEKEPTMHNFYAVYPYGEAKRKYVYAINVPALQNQTGDYNYGVMTASGSSRDLDNVKLEFTYPLTTLKMVIDAAGSPFATETIDSFKLISEKGLAGDMECDVRTGEVSDAQENAIEADYAQPQQLSAPLTAWLTLCPVDMTEERDAFVLELETENFRGTFTLKPQKNYEAQGLYTYDVNLKELIDAGMAEVEMVAPEYEAESNSYMVKPGESVVFGVQHVYDIWKEMFSKRLTRDTEAVLVWETTAGLIDRVGMLHGIQGPKGGIEVKVNSGKNGNALVALKVDGEVRWTWHIWAIDPAIIATHETPEGIVFMDRNLGAITAAPEIQQNTWGLYYQWGRPQPLAWADQQELAVSQSYPSPLYDAEGAEIPYSLENKITSAEPLKDAFTKPMIMISNWYGADGNDSWVKEGDRTRFDPCPAGWRVAHYTNIDGEPKSPFINMTASGKALSGSRVRGIYFGDAWFPATGKYLCTANLLESEEVVINNGGKQVHYWFADASSYSYAYSLLAMGLGNPKHNQEYFKSEALPVRCVKNI